MELDDSVGFFLSWFFVDASALGVSPGVLLQ